MEMLFLILIAVVGRLVPHPANMTPVGAVAVFAGSRLGVKRGLLVTLASMLASDLLVGLHPVMWATYASLLAGVVIGAVAVRNISAVSAGSAILSSAVLFFIVTNFAVWALPASMYPKTPAGLLESYVMAFPFFRNSLIGDLAYGTLFFTGWELVTNAVSKRAAAVSAYLIRRDPSHS